MPVFEQIRLSNVALMTTGQAGHFGHGFSITNQHGSPLLSMIYPVEEEAQDARKAIEATLAKAVAIVTPGP